MPGLLGSHSPRFPLHSSESLSRPHEKNLFPLRTVYVLCIVHLPISRGRGCYRPRGAVRIMTITVHVLTISCARTMAGCRWENGRSSRAARGVPPTAPSERPQRDVEALAWGQDGTHSWEPSSVRDQGARTHILPLMLPDGAPIGEAYYHRDDCCVTVPRCKVRIAAEGLSRGQGCPIVNL